MFWRGLMVPFQSPLVPRPSNQNLLRSKRYKLTSFEVRRSLCKLYLNCTHSYTMVRTTDQPGNHTIRSNISTALFGLGAVLMGKAVLILGPISAQRSVGSLSVTMGFLCDDGVFVWRSSQHSNPVTIGPVLIKSVTIATPLC